MRKKIFITGISGLLGTNLAKELLDKNYFINAIVRDPNSYLGKRTSNLNLINMDLFSDYSNYLKACDIVIHIAAETATNLVRYSDYDKINYQATIRLFELAKKQKVAQFIFISTSNTTGYGNFKVPGNELQDIKKPFSKIYYAETKKKAEKYLLENQQHIDLRILNPTFMIGPYDSKPSSGKIILMSLNKKIVFYPPGGKNFVPVKDVVCAIINSFEFGKSGEKYLIAGENYSYKDFFRKIKKNTSQRQLLIPIPKPLLLILGLTGDLLRKMNIKTSLSSSNMQTLCVKNYYCNQKSIQELKISYSSLDNAIDETIHYFKRGALKSK